MRHFREARKSAYTVKNIKSAFESTGIVPLNLRRILWRYTGTASPDPAQPVTPTPALTLSATPSSSRGVHNMHQVAIQLVKDPQAHFIIDKLAAAIGGLTGGFLGQVRALQVEAAMYG